MYISGHVITVEIDFFPGPFNSSQNPMDASAFAYYRQYEGGGKAGVTICDKTFNFTPTNNSHEFKCDSNIDPNCC